MKIAPLVIGAVYGQSGDYDYSAPAASAGEERWDSWGVDNSFNMAAVSDTGRAYVSTGTTSAVTCWESNNMGDLAHYNSYDDTHGWQNRHHGHDQLADQGHISTDDNGNADDPQVGTWYKGHSTPHTGNDIHSIAAFDNRYSGCIYELSSWTYDSNSYNKKWKVTYGRDAADTNHEVTGIDKSHGNDAAGDAIWIRPNWWHYFNAHVFDAGTHATHYITMANPQYEGLGYLNFIVTYARNVAGPGSGGDDGYANRDKNFNTLPDKILTDNYSAGDAFVFAKGDSTDEEWYSVYTRTDDNAGTWVAEGAISSFPHNDLGKDFRFNIRVLTKLGNGNYVSPTKDSYYFYKINTISITFPKTVRCPREANNISIDSGTDTFRCMDAANNNGHRSWDNTVSNPAGASQSNDEKYNTPTYTESLSGGSATAAICGSSAVNDEWYQCGDAYTVSGLMNTYDEQAQNEYGVYQEFWFQFYYHFELDITSTSVNSVASTNGAVKPYNFPNILFNAFEVTSVAFTCSNAGRKNPNIC